MSDTNPFRVAIVGAGPAGCYLAQALIRGVPDTEITIFDQGVAPYGLIRSGVAADHQHTKTITRQFERLFQQPNVRFAGNVRVVTTTPSNPAPPNSPHAEVTLDTLHAHFDAVVLATGAFEDRPLNVAGGALPGVVGAGRIIRSLNSAPGAPQALPNLGTDVVIVGLGNVALDLLRFLVKTDAEYVQSDVNDTALASYTQTPAQRITVLSRASAAHSKADAAMLAELAKLPRGTYRSPDVLPDAHELSDRTAQARVRAFETLLSAERPSYPGPEVTIRFETTPLRVLGKTEVTGVEITAPHAAPHTSRHGDALRGDTSDEPITDDATSERIPATTVLTAIGFMSAPDSSTAAAALTDSERLSYRTGWAKRGSVGGIPENRSCAKSVADEIMTDIASGRLLRNSRTDGFAGLPASVQEKSVDFLQWLNLDAHEQHTAAADRLRCKTSDHTEMLQIAVASPTATSPSRKDTL